MIDVKNIDGSILFSVTLNESAVYHEELMQSDYIQLQWHSSENKAIPAGAYIENDSEKYRLLEPYTPQQVNELSYNYTPQFQSRVSAWSKQITPVYTYEEDGTTVKSRDMDWEFTGSPADAMHIVKQAIKNETGEEWSVQLSESLPATITISSQSASIYSILNSIASECDTEWWADKNTNTLYLSQCIFGEPVVLEVGNNINVPTVQTDNKGYYTRFFAFGSTRNMPQTSVEGQANVNNRLTLDTTKYPNGYKDIRAGLKDGEIFPTTLYFDDIYPSSKLTISDVRARLRYRLDNSGNKIKIGGTDEEPIYEQYAIWYFQIAGFDFNPETIIEGLNLSASFESGQLAGRDFELTYHEKAETVRDANDVTPFEVKAGDYEIVIDETSGQIIPGISYIVPQEGDSVILFNIEMPAEYTASAQVELEKALDKAIAEQDSDTNSYQFDSDPTVFYEQAINIQMGQSITYINGSKTLSTRAMMVEKRLDLPCYQTIKVGNKVIKGTTQQLKEEVTQANQNIDVINAFNKLSAELAQAYANAQREMIEGFSAIKEMWELKKDDEGNMYVFSKFDVATRYGITTYTAGLAKLPQLVESIPYDNVTIWYNKEKGVVEVLGGTGGTGGGIPDAPQDGEAYARKDAAWAKLDTLRGEISGKSLNTVPYEVYKSKRNYVYVNDGGANIGQIMAFSEGTGSIYTQVFSTHYTIDDATQMPTDIDYNSIHIYTRSYYLKDVGDNKAGTWGKWKELNLFGGSADAGSGFMFGGWITTNSPADTEKNNKIYIAYESGTYTHFLGSDGSPLNVVRPVALMRNMSVGNYWYMQPLNGLYEYSQRYAFGKKTGFLGGSVCMHAFKATETFNQSSFPVSLAFQTQLQSVTECVAMEGAGVVFPRSTDPSYAYVKNLQRQADEISVCDNYVVWISTNDCTNSIDIADFTTGLNAVIKKLKAKKTDARIFLVAPLKCRLTGTQRGDSGYAPGDKGNDPTSQDAHALVKYAEAVCQVGANWSIPVLNLFNSSLIDVFDSTQMMDGTHPLPAGYALIADLMANWVATGYSAGSSGSSNAKGGGISDAPSNGLKYVRQNGAWAELIGEQGLSKFSLNPIANQTVAIEVERLDRDKQDTLESGTNIKTVNGQSILGSGNIEVSGGSGGGIAEAPNDGKTYGRKNGGWSELETLRGVVTTSTLNDVPATPYTSARNFVYKNTGGAVVGQITAFSEGTGTVFTQILQTHYIINQSTQLLETIDYENVYTYKRSYYVKAVNGHSAGTWGNWELQNTKKSLKILLFGNSFSQDSFGYLPFVMKHIAPEVDLTVGIAYIGGCSLAQHLASFTGQSQTLNGTTVSPQDYWFDKCVSGTPWTNDLKRHTVTEILGMERWDIITFQQNGGDAFKDFATYYAPFIYKLHKSLFGKLNHAVKLGWLLTHGSYATTESAFKTNWQGTAENAYKVMATTPTSLLFPYGTAVQNLRETSLKSLGDGSLHNLTADNVHLQEGVGCLAAAYVNCLVLLKSIGLECKGVFGESTRPNKSYVTDNNIPGPHLGTSDSVIGINNDNVLLAQIAADCAVKNPYSLMNPETPDYNITLP